jgi:hypothetical protein
MLRTKQINIQEIYSLNTFHIFVYLRTNIAFCHLQHKWTGFYKLNEKCLQRGTAWGYI